MTTRIKPLAFRGTTLQDLKNFPARARQEAGHQLDLLQQGGMPDDWKPLKVVGSGASEIRLRQDDGAFRVVYVAKFEAAIYVLHCFQKKTQQTAQVDIDLATKRYRDLIKEIDQ